MGVITIALVRMSLLAGLDSVGCGLILAGLPAGERRSKQRRCTASGADAINHTELASFDWVSQTGSAST